MGKQVGPKINPSGRPLAVSQYGNRRPNQFASSCFLPYNRTFAERLSPSLMGLLVFLLALAVRASSWLSAGNRDNSPAKFVPPNAVVSGSSIVRLSQLSNMNRKYRQSGYQEKQEQKEERRSSRPRNASEGPRSPRMPGFHQVFRCSLCGAILPPTSTEINFSTRCPKCGAGLHSCKNCTFFDPSSRFECAEVVTERIVRKDSCNQCQFFKARTRTEKKTGSAPQRSLNPREAFDQLFKK